MLSEHSPGFSERESKHPYSRDEVSVATGVLRLVGRRGDLLAQDDTQLP
jgi:hypothetical protein